MSSDCKNRNPLQRSGVNQYQRVLAALLPTHAKVDERDYADLILFARNYASQLNYFNSANSLDGNWQALMSMDVSVTLATLIKLDVQGCFSYVKDLQRKVQETNIASVGDLKNYFKILCDVGFSITNILNEYYELLPGDFEFKNVLGNAIQSNLPEYYNRLKRYYDEAIVQGIVNSSDTLLIEPVPIPITLSQNFNESDLSQKWFNGSIPVFTPAFNGGSIALKIKNTNTHNLFTGIFDQYLKSLSKVVEQASLYLDRTLSSFPTHTPHYALYLSFIKLFRFAQDHVNEFTKRHLDLYYKEILKLSSKEAQPDCVHLTFELTKAVKDNYLVRKDTVFKAGKDVDGEEIFYALTDNVVLNKGSIKMLRSAFVARDIASDTRQLFFNPVANSEDGQGGKLMSVDKSWRTFGDNMRIPATIGFAIASNYLYLREGKRVVTFHFFAQEGEPITFFENDIHDLFTLQLSGEKGWVDVPVTSNNVVLHDAESFSITVSLDGGEPAIVPYSQKLHGFNFNTNLPVAKFLVNKAIAKDAIWNFAFSKIDLTVDVSGMKDVVIQNDTGSLDASKSFDLFGASPHVGSSFVVGSKEVFMKTLQPVGNVSVKLNFTWDNYAELIDKIDTGNNHTVDIYHLEDAEWKTTHLNKKLFTNKYSSVFMPDLTEMQEMTRLGSMMPMVKDFEAISLSPVSAQPLAAIDNFGSMLVRNYILQNSNIAISLPTLDVAADYSENEDYDAKSAWGFIKLELNAPEFGHSTYTKDLADAAKDATITTTDNGDGTTSTKVTIKEVGEPYTPKAKAFSLNYIATTSLDFSNEEEGTFIHVTPFGSKDFIESSDRNLLPSFDHEGELFIGIENFVTDQTLSILFQVAEGTADPLAVKQEVFWYFLSANNEWIEFKKEDVADNTNDLTQSGIIKFGIPDEAVAVNTIMSDQLHWIRAVVPEKTNALCKLIEVTAQAAKATFYDYKKSGNYFKSVLPANTISKTVISDAAVKKISQPYASFGGRAREDDQHFYIRASERLRHKNRSIAMWDYERMVLEAYPSIYKVKCINHAQILEKGLGTKTSYVDNELKPGYVLVIPIPDLQNKNAFDPFRPYTSLGLLTEIKKYLYKYVSSHVNLDVRNPQFEEIQLEFKIRYVIADNDFYTKLLKQEIEQYLSPWAYDPHTDIEFGGKISKSMLIDFIEERSYVDYLSCVKMYRIVEGVKSADAGEVVATSARSVFVSVKSADILNAHKISFITEDCDC
jgi:hypothetical protein